MMRICCIFFKGRKKDYECFYHKKKTSQVRWRTPVIPALRLRQKDHEIEASLGYITRLSQKNDDFLRR
jgi:hypothetical protein